MKNFLPNFTGFTSNLLRTFLIHQFVVELVASSENFNVIEEVGVDGGETDSTVVHLAGEYFISIEVISKNTTI